MLSFFSLLFSFLLHFASYTLYSSFVPFPVLFFAFCLLCLFFGFSSLLLLFSIDICISLLLRYKSLFVLILVTLSFILSHCLSSPLFNYRSLFTPYLCLLSCALFHGRIRSSSFLIVLLLSSSPTLCIDLFCFALLYFLVLFLSSLLCSTSISFLVYPFCFVLLLSFSFYPFHFSFVPFPFLSNPILCLLPSLLFFFHLSIFLFSRLIRSFLVIVVLLLFLLFHCPTSPLLYYPFLTLPFFPLLSYCILSSPLSC